MHQPASSSATPTPTTSLDKMLASRFTPFLILLLVTLCVMLPVWLIGLPFSGHDAATHARWQVVFAEQFWGGEPYPRWLGELNQGLGSPAFFIYPPLPHIIAALLAPLSDGAAWAQQRLGIASTLALLVGSGGAYLWLRELTRERVSALCGALVFLLAPYHLFLDTYYRAAYAELWAFAWAPFSLWAIHVLARKPARGVFVYTLATAALALSHAPSCLVLPPLYLVYAALLSYSTRRKSILLWTCGASAAAVMITGAYLATALAHQNYINTAALYTGFFEFDRWMLLSGRWPGGELTISGIAVVQFAALFVLGVAMPRASQRDQGHRILMRSALAASIFMLFMMTTIAAPLWELVPIAKKVQFPWRLLTAQTMLFALVFALYVLWVRRTDRQARSLRHWLTLPLLAMLIAVNVGLAFIARPAFERHPMVNQIDVPEYQLGDIGGTAALFDKDSNIRVLSGQGTARLEAVSARHLRIHLDAASEVRIVVRQFFYPGWQCTDTGTPAHCRVTSLNPQTPALTIDAGAGRRQIDVVLGKTQSERIGILVSCCGLVLLVLLCLAAHIGSRRASKRF